MTINRHTPDAIRSRRIVRILRNAALRREHFDRAGAEMLEAMARDVATLQRTGKSAAVRLPATEAQSLLLTEFFVLMVRFPVEAERLVARLLADPEHVLVPDLMRSLADTASRPRVEIPFPTVN